MGFVKTADIPLQDAQVLKPEEVDLPKPVKK
jgi:hypothetical protein